MKSKNAKRIAAVAASLLMGLAFGAGVTYNNIPIINSAGQPVVQIVVGSGQGSQYTPAPSDGVVAANIAAVIGNLAFTSQNVTATVGGQNSVTCVVTTPSCTLTNQQVWLGESGLSASGGSYAFYALIGSVLNSAIPLNSPASTKFVQGAGQYTYPEVPSTSVNPFMSPYTGLGTTTTSSSGSESVPVGSILTGQGGNTGGLIVSSPYFSVGQTPPSDNLLRVTSTQLPALANNWGAHTESENLWVAGFPVFDQATGVNQFRLLSATGAYQATFGTQININLNATAVGSIMGSNSAINVPIKLLGQNYTILKAYSTTTQVATGNVVPGGKITLAASLTQPTTIYVGKNITTGPFTVVLQDLGQPNSQGISAASVGVYYKGVLTNTSSIIQGQTQLFNISNQKLYVNVQTTFAGLYAYQKWAKIQVYSNILNLTSGQQVNQTTNPGWYSILYWTNNSAGTKASALSSIVLYNYTPTVLAPQQSLTFIQQPAAWKLTFVGDTLTPASFDSVSFQSSSATNVQYTNLGNKASSLAISNITEPAAELTVTSQIPNAFTYAGQQSGTVVFDLTPYQLNDLSNTANAVGTNAITAASNAWGAAGVLIPSNTVDNVIITSEAPGSDSTAGWISLGNNNPLSITIKGWGQPAAGSSASPNPATAAVQVYSLTNVGTNAFVQVPAFYNISSITIGRAIPGNFVVQVWGAQATNTLGTGGSPANVIQLANLSSISGGAIIYPPTSGQVYQTLTTGSVGSVTYNPGSTTETFGLTPTVTGATAATSTTSSNQFYSFSVTEVAVPANTVATSQYEFGIVNATGGVTANPLFNLNYSATSTSLPGTKNNVTYVSSSIGTANTIKVSAGFVSERGSKLTSISPTSVVFNLAKSADQLLFTVGPAGSASVTTTTSSFGPYKIGQATNLPNVTIANVTASCTGGNVSTSSCSVSGLSNLTATPSVTKATTPVYLHTDTTPLVVLDTNANQSATLIVVGSKYVNSVAASIFQQQPGLDSSFGPGSVIAAQEGSNRILVAGYAWNDTVTAGNNFIGQLLTAAGQQP